jgi:hypothetical protein
VKKLLIGLAVVVGLGAVASGLGSSTETDPPPTANTKTKANNKVTVPLKVSGPDKSYTAGDSARVSRGGRVTFTAAAVAGTCEPLDDTESPEKWCRGGSQMYRMDANVQMKGGKSVECSQNNETFWGDTEKQTIDIPCEEKLDTDKVKSVELLGSTP